MSNINLYSGNAGIQLPANKKNAQILSGLALFGISAKGLAETAKMKSEWSIFFAVTSVVGMCMVADGLNSY